MARWNKVAGPTRASEISGQLTYDKIASIDAQTITVGTISSGQIGSIDAGTITVGLIASSQVADELIDSLKLIAANLRPIERVASQPALPSDDYPVGSYIRIGAGDPIVYTVYKNESDTWVAKKTSEVIGHLQSEDIVSIDAATITVGLIAAGQIESVDAASITVGTIAAEQIGSVDAATITVGTISASQIGSIEANQITVVSGGITSSQIDTVAAGSIEAGTISGCNIDASENINAIGEGGVTDVAGGSIYVYGSGVGAPQAVIFPGSISMVTAGGAETILSPAAGLEINDVVVIDEDGIVAIGSIPTGTSSSTVCIGNDSRLSDARRPTLADDATPVAQELSYHYDGSMYLYLNDGVNSWKVQMTQVV